MLGLGETGDVSLDLGRLEIVSEATASDRVVDGDLFSSPPPAALGGEEVPRAGVATRGGVPLGVLTFGVVPVELFSFGDEEETFEVADGEEASEMMRLSIKDPASPVAAAVGSLYSLLKSNP